MQNSPRNLQAQLKTAQTQYTTKVFNRACKANARQNYL
jgi:hypothetical protein